MTLLPMGNKCPKCGAKLKSGVKICPKCSSPVIKPVSLR